MLKNENEDPLYEFTNNQQNDNGMEQAAVETKPKKVLKKFDGPIIAIIVAAAVIWCLWSGIRGLFLVNEHSMEDVYQNPVKKEVYSGDLVLASKEYVSIKHTISGLIPFGTEHYYLAYSPDMKSIISIRAPKNWDKDFTDDYINTIQKRERGMIRELDYKVKQDLLTITQSLSEQDLQIESQLYLDLTVNKLCYMQIFTGIMLALCSIYLVLMLKDKLPGNGTVRTARLSLVVIIIFIFTLMLFAHVLVMVT